MLGLSLWAVWEPNCKFYCMFNWSPAQYPVCTVKLHFKSVLRGVAARRFVVRAQLGFPYRLRADRVISCTFPYRLRAVS